MPLNKETKTSLPLLSGPLQPTELIPVRVPSKGQKDLLKNYSNSIEPSGKKNSKERTAQKMLT